MICSKCGANVAEGNAFCIMCGTPLKQQEETWFHSAMGAPVAKTEVTEAPYIPAQRPICPHCGTLLKEDSHFCHRCGNRVSNDPFCPHCATTLPTDAQFCHRCGKSTQPPTKPEAAPKNRKKLFLIIGSAAAALLLVIGIWMIWLFSGRTAEETALQYIDAVFTTDVDTLVELIPREVLTYIAEEEGYDKDEIDEFLEELEDLLRDLEDMQDRYYGRDWTYTCKVLDTDELSNRELQDLQEIYEDELDLQVKEAVIVELDYSIGGEIDKQSGTVEIPLIKIGRLWYFDYLSMGSLF